MKNDTNSLKTVAAAILLAGALALPANAQDAYGPVSLGTRPGFDLGAQASYYHYGESFRHSFEDEQYGPKYAIIASGTLPFAYDFFGTVEGRLAYGQNHYDDRGDTKDNVPDYLGEGRILGGKDFIMSQFGLSAYTGLGYRNLYNDMTGNFDNGGSATYRTYNQYFYVPVGITPRFRISNDVRISTNLEYDQLIKGWETSYLGDATPRANSIINAQNSGYGLRGSIMVEWTNWSFGPFADYWNIDQSSTKFTTVSDGCASGCSIPHNNTYELGLQAKYHF